MRKMKTYDVIVVGSGCGGIIASEAVAHHLKTAMVDRGPLGGTCLNLGCIPSKMLIYAADRIMEIEEAGKLGVRAEVKDIDFGAIMERMRKSRAEGQQQIKEGISHSANLDLYEGECHFTEDRTLEVKGERIKADKILIASGSRPLIPPIKGLGSIDYLTNETVLELKERPDSLIIIGGGYIAVEYGHFFAAMGTKVTILEMADRLVLSEEREISELLKKELSKRMEVHTNAQVQEVRALKGNVTAVTKDTGVDKLVEFTAQRIMVAVGRRSNADLLKVENAGIETDKRGFIKVNNYFQTSKKNVFAVGDAIGRYMFTHVANREATIAAHNALHNAKLEMDYSAIPHAIYSHPQIASVGLMEENAKKEHDIVIARSRYSDVAKGEAMMEMEGFAKAVLEKGTGKILGFHILGPYAPELIQEVTNAMASGGQADAIGAGIHIHPALSELIPVTLAGVEKF
jgi:mycothione reductase